MVRSVLEESHSALCQLQDRRQRHGIEVFENTEKDSLTKKETVLAIMVSEIVQLRFLNSVKDRDLEGLASEIAKLSNDLKHALEMNKRLINGRTEIIVESQEQLFQELEKQNLLKVREYNMSQAVKLAEDKIAKIEEEQKHER